MLSMFCMQVKEMQVIIIRPSSDRTYYGMVMSVRPGLCPSIHLSVTFSALFSYMILDNNLCETNGFFYNKLRYLQL